MVQNSKYRIIYTPAMDPSNNSTLDKYIFIGDNDQSGEFRAGYWLSDQPSAG